MIESTPLYSAIQSVVPANFSCLLNIDNRDELLRLVRIAGDMGKRPSVGLRVNVSEGRSGGPAWDRFGFSLENGEAREICEEIKNRRYPLDVAGLHLHLGTNISDVALYSRAAKKIVAFAAECESMLQTKISYLDLGGGFAVNGNRLKASQKTEVPHMNDYIEAIAKELSRDKNRRPMLILEPGRWLVAESMALLTTVISMKNMPDIATVVTDASVSILREAAFIDFKIEAIKNEAANILTRVYGCSCIQSDILGNALLPLLKRGDILAIDNVGAYSIPRSSQWIFPRPAVVCIDRNGTVRILRRAETKEDLIRLDV